MIEFTWPWLSLLLPLPILAWRFLPPLNNVNQAALNVPFLDDFGDADPTDRLSSSRSGLILASIGWLLLVLASTRPVWLGEPVAQAVSGRDMLLAVDVSGSMREQDFVINQQAVDRLSAIKNVAGEFISRRSGDRIGLILFGTTAYLQTPLTFDRDTVRTMLNEAFIGITDDDPATSIGDAIGLAVKRLEAQKDARVLVLLTDGANTAGEVTPLKAAQIAADKQIKIYTIGVGADEMVVRSFFGNRRVNPSAELDEKTLRAIAEKTGGEYFRARDSQQLEQIYALLDELEPVEKDQQYFRPRREFFHWPLAVALLLFSLLSLMRLRRS